MYRQSNQVVINKCWGGFGLSLVCMAFIYRKWGNDVVVRNGNIYRLVKDKSELVIYDLHLLYDNTPCDVCEDICACCECCRYCVGCKNYARCNAIDYSKDDVNTDYARISSGYTLGKKIDQSELNCTFSSIDRGDRYLIEAVDELNSNGYSRADGEYARLEIENVQCGYEIEEYDGKERIVYNDRRW